MPIVTGIIIGAGAHADCLCDLGSVRQRLGKSSMYSKGRKKLKKGRGVTVKSLYLYPIPFLQFG